MFNPYYMAGPHYLMKSMFINSLFHKHSSGSRFTITILHGPSSIWVIFKGVLEWSLTQLDLMAGLGQWNSFHDWVMFMGFMM